MEQYDDHFCTSTVGYEPLHHKYRPQTFSDLVGQDAIATTLTHAIESQRIAPAYLFTGPRGTGKTSSSRILAKSLNCLTSERPTPQPCGHCSVCQDIARGDSLDVIEIDAASNTGVDNIRDLIERAQFAPVQCRYKIYCLDEVHMLSTAAFNALLKTLEEPPAQVVFVLATTDPQRVLATIISRCQRFDFRRIPLAAMITHLAHIATQEAIAITPAAIELVAQIAQGGLRDAESLLDQLSLQATEITPDHIWDLVGSVPERDLMVLLQAIVAQQPDAILAQTQQLLNRGREPLVVLQSLTSFYRDLLIAKTAPDRRDLVAITESTWSELCQFSQSLDINTILQGQQHLRTCEPQVKNTTQPRLWLDVGLLGLLPGAAPAPASAPAPRPVSQPIAPVTAAPPPQPAVSVPPAPSAAPTIPVAPIPVTPVVPVATPAPVPSPSPPPVASPPAVPTASAQPTASVQPTASAQPTASVQPTASAQPAAANPPPTPAAAAPMPEPPTHDTTQLWQQVLVNLNPAGKALFTQYGQLASYRGGQAEIAILKSLVKTAQGKVPEVEAAFEKLVHRTVKVSLIVSTGKPQAAPAAQSTPTSPPPTPIHPGSAPGRVQSPPPPVQPPTMPPPAAPGPPAGAEPNANGGLAVAPLVSAQAPAAPGWEVEDQFTQNARSFARFFAGTLVEGAADDVITADNSTVS